MLTERDIEILRVLARYYVLSRAQIQSLCFQGESTDGAGARVTRRRLQSLVSDGYINRMRTYIFNPAMGTPAPVYFPAKKGCEFLAVHFGDDRYYAVPFRPPQAELALHWLAISDTHLLMDAAIALQQDVELAGWLNEYDQVNADAESPEDRYRIYTLIRRQPRLVCAPDAAFLLAAYGHKKVYYLEQDRATSGVRQIAASKTLGYAAMAEMSLHKKHFPDATIPGFAVLMITTDPRRRDALRKEIGKKPGAGLWKFASVTDLRPDTFLFEPVFHGCDDTSPMPLVRPRSTPNPMASEETS
ncbi:MAG: replication-relaxation family protein [Planctomycetota bacterium]